MTILDTIVARKREEVARQQRAWPLTAVQEAAARAAPPRDFFAALRTPGVALIAEVKRASPSKGPLRPDLDAADLAGEYAANGAAAISVLTDAPFFHGCLDDLRTVRQAVGLPLLRKEFVVDPYQLYEARAAGADAVLLIAAILRDDELREYTRLAERLGMLALLEVHDEAELERALRTAPRAIGINNRNLRTFEVSLETTARLRPLLPAGVALVAESGIHTRADVERLAAIGVDAMLVGEALVTAQDVGWKVRELLGKEAA